MAKFWITFSMFILKSHAFGSGVFVGCKSLISEKIHDIATRTAIIRNIFFDSNAHEVKSGKYLLHLAGFLHYSTVSEFIGRHSLAQVYAIRCNTPLTVADRKSTTPQRIP